MVIMRHGKNSPMLAEFEAKTAYETYAGLDGRDLIKAVVRDYGKRAALVSSFGAESSVLLHMVSELAPDLAVIFLDTEKLFPETYAYRDQLVEELSLTNVRVIKPDEKDLKIWDADGTLHQSSTDQCCHVRKTISLEKALSGFDVVISGRKRFHGAARAGLDFVSVQDGRMKVEPLAGFSGLDLHSYMVNHHLPSHPLKLRGYLSIGCMPCTVPGGTIDDPRAGRWAGSDKTECGIHFTSNGQVVRTEKRGAALV
jgi:phosphoadenosine phosphosulfate reductase